MKLNDKDIENFYLNVKEEISCWAKTSKGKKYHYTSELLEFPELFCTLNNIRISNNIVLCNAGLSKKINNTIQYIVSDLDILPEFFIGPPGYLDDFYILCLCLKDIADHSDSKVRSLGIDIEYINGILDDGKNMFSLNILEQIEKVYISY